MSEKEIVRANGSCSKVKVLSGEGYSIPKLSTLASLKDTGNGFIVKFPSHSSVRQDNYVCLDYAEADYLYKALTPIMVLWASKED